MPEDDEHDQRLRDEDDEAPDDIYFASSSSNPKYGVPFKTKILFWSIVAGSIAVGTFLFLFFLTVFIYFFVPLFILLLLWAAFQRFLRR